mgnify:CR=1 FL=1
MKTLRKVLETITEKLLMASGYITSITIILMVVFLFREGAGLFNTPDIEEGYVLAVNRENPVQKLSPQQVMQGFDGDIASWGTLGWGGGDSIRLFRLDDITAYATPEELGEKLENVPQCLSRIVASHKNIIAYLPKQLIAEDFAGRILDEGKITPASFLGGKLWYPTAQPAPQFGVLPLILGTLWVSIAAILIALPFGLAVAIYMAELAGHRLRNLLKPVIELLAGIPSVVYGFFGMIVLVPAVQAMVKSPFFKTVLHVKSGKGMSLFTAAVLLGIMILPTIITVSKTSLDAVPDSYYEGSLALGATHERSVFFASLPAAKSGILAAIILGVGRAIGETMAVILVAGNQTVIPKSITSGIRTLTSNIVMEMGYAGGLHREALIATGVVLFVFILIINLCFSALKRRKD